MNANHSMIHPTIKIPQNDSLTMVATAKNFLSREECKKIIDYSESHANFDEGVVNTSGDNSSLRNSKVTFLPAVEENMWFFNRLESAIKQLNQAYKYDLVGLYEGVQIASYSNGGNYGNHIDIGPGNTSTRKLSLSIQLSDSDDYEGGELEFMNVEQNSERAIGTLIAFPAFLQHCVTPVVKGKRYSMVAWVHGHPFR